MLGILEPEHYWFRPAVEAAKKVIENKKIDIVYSRSSCINSNLVGLAIKKEFNLPWIAHFSDPWIENSIRKFNAIQKERLIKYEFEVVHSADYLEFTSDETIPLVMKKYGLHQLEKAFCSPHGFDEDVKRLVSPEEISTENKLVLSYSGSFYEKRSPITLFFALQRMSQDDLEKIQIILNGPDLERYTSTLKRLNIQKAVKLIPSKSYLLSLSLASTADVLMVIDAPNDEESVFLPSKLSDYMLLSKPVIGLTPYNGASANLIRELGGNVVDPLDIEGIKALLCHLLQLWEQNKLAVSDNYYITREKYSVKEANSKLHKKLLELTDH